jgi:AmmeMemoRadiSam system protein B
MAEALPPLRRALDFMPSPDPQAPGLLIRDPFRYSDSVLVLPPALVPCLLFFDGRHDEDDLRTALVRLTGDNDVGPLLEHVTRCLREAGFLEDAAFDALREERHRAFAASPVRAAAHAGSAYPAEAAELGETLDHYLRDAPSAPPATDGLGIAAPHVSPEGGWRSYAAAYAPLRHLARGRTFVVLGTSHYGEPGRFGLTHKPFATPLGETSVDRELVATLAATGGPAVCLEDYCHVIEHSIEFQVVFLQHLFGGGVTVVPILCGPFDAAGGAPEDDPGVAGFLSALREATRREDVFWVLGVDMAHVGRRYGDRLDARAGEGPLVEVEALDRDRCVRLAAGDAAGFWGLIGARDDLKWCGSSPLYTFLKAAAPSAGRLLHYEQWNIDPRSVVSFAALSFSR